MARAKPQAQNPKSTTFNILAIGQSGRLQYEALILAASLRKMAPDFPGELIIAEPQPGPLWTRDPRMRADVKQALTDLGAKVVPFESTLWGSRYPNGNKIEALKTLPEGTPFLFLDSDTLITGDIGTLAHDFAKPSASMRRTGTWPVEELYWPGYTATWKSLYDKFELDFDSSLDLDQPDEYWQRYLYFNAGWFLGQDPATFGARFADYAQAIEQERPDELVLQPLDPWLDQVALPLVIHSFGGGRPGPELDGLDGALTCHYRLFPLLYARESDRVVAVLENVTAPNPIKRLLKDYDPIKKMIYHGQGRKLREMIAAEGLPRDEKTLRNRLRTKGFWMR